jgi:hypothetical protein
MWLMTDVQVCEPRVILMYTLVVQTGGAGPPVSQVQSASHTDSIMSLLDVARTDL